MDWHAIEAAADRAVVGAFGELVRHAPMKDSKIDPTRAAADIRGVLHTPAAKGSFSLGGGFLITLSASEGALVVNRADCPDRIFR